MFVIALQLYNILCLALAARFRFDSRMGKWMIFLTHLSEVKLKSE